MGGFNCPDVGGSKHIGNVGYFYQKPRHNIPEDSHLHTGAVRT
jgi:hypothetical protein